METRRGFLAVLLSLVPASLLVKVIPAKKLDAEAEALKKYWDETEWGPPYSIADLKRMYPEVHTVQVLDHYSSEYVYKPYRTFSTEAEAEEWVRSLTPQLLWVGIRRDQVDIDEMTVGIVHKPGMELEFEGYGLSGLGVFYSLTDAWMFLSNIRVNGRPVSRTKKEGGISEYLTQPFSRGNPVIEEDITTDYKTPKRDELIHQIKSGYRNAVRFQVKL